MLDLEFIERYIEDRKEFFIELASRVWEFAELPYEEVKSANLLIEVLRREGFEIQEGLAAIPTSFKASFGSSSPVFGFLGEYDALDTLSQEAAVAERKPFEESAPGHGCGHNLLGVGSLAAALACKEYLLANNLDGTVIYFGCPAEEGAGSKQFMARAGVFDGVDFVYTWHPATKNEVQSNRSLAIMGANFTFRGISSHAGGSPWLGRSALDAAELMSVGCNYLREHMYDQERIHYAYANAGGVAPNVVQDYVQVKYEVRSPKVKDMKKLFQRVVKVAQGAALMTETRVDYVITMAFSDYRTNSKLAPIADQALKDVGPPKWDEEDYLFAREILNSYNEETLEGIKNTIIQTYGIGRLEEKLERPLDDVVHPYDGRNVSYAGGSTDVGDVSYCVPTLNFHIACQCIGNVGHTWQTTAQSNSSIGYKGMLTAAKAMALAVIRTAKRPDVIEEAKEEVVVQNGGKYECPLPDYVKPPIGKY